MWPKRGAAERRGPFDSKRPVPLRFLFPAVAFAIANASPARGQGWMPIGPNDVARVNVLSASATAIYAGTDNGIYRSADRGSSWQEAGLQRESIARISVEPGSDTIYAIVDNHFFVPAEPEPSLLGALFGSSLRVSRDGGRTWATTPFFNALSVAVDPTRPGTAYAGSYDGDYYPLAVTRDSGTTWSRVEGVPQEFISHLTVDPRDGTVYGGEVTLVVGAGDLWSSLALNLIAVGVGHGPDGAVYGIGFQSFCRKSLAAPEWSCHAAPWPGALSVLEIPATSQAAARILVSGFDEFWSSDDGGLTWSTETSHPGGYMPALTLDPGGTFVYAGNDVGVHRSADGGETWTNSSTGLSSTWVRTIVLDPNDAATMWVGGLGRGIDFESGAGIFRSRDSGRSWAAVSGPDQKLSITSIAVDPRNPARVFASARPSSILKSSDGGTSWSKTDLSTGFIFGLAADPETSELWLAAAGGGLKRSTDGVFWHENSVSAQDIYCLLFDSRQPGTIYGGTADTDPGYYYPYGTGGRVFTSRNAGGQWSRSAQDLGDAVIAFALDPFSEGVAYANTWGTGMVFRSSDSGANWERWDAENPGYGTLTWALAADPVRSGTLYSAGWTGVFRSVDGGRHWHSFSEGLSPYGVLGLAVSTDGEWLYAGTTGGGVFKRNLMAEPRGSPGRLSDERPSTQTIGPRGPEP